MKTLAARGHQVTVISPDPLKVSLKCTVELSSQVFRLKEKCAAKPTEGESTLQYETNYRINIGILKHCFRAIAS
jgi:hypothetical protein